MNLAIAIGATLLLAAFYSWTNRMNSTFFFGRSVPADLRESAAGRAIAHRYQARLGVATAVAVVVAWEASHIGRSFGFAGALAEALMFFVIFGRANREARALQQQSGVQEPQPSLIQVALMDPPRYWIPGLGMILTSPIIGALAVLGCMLWMAHGGGLAAGWSALDTASDGHGIAGLFGLGTGMLAAATGMLLLFRGSARLRTNMAQYTVRAGVTMQWIGAALIVTMLGCILAGAELPHALMRWTAGALAVAVLGVLAWNQARSRRFVPSAPELGGDDRWRWGLFYVDRNDPALFVQSRCGAGYSLNYGRMLAWPITAAVWAYLVAVLFLPHHH